MMKAGELDFIHAPASYAGFDVVVNAAVPPGEVWLVTEQRIIVINNIGVFKPKQKWRHQLMSWVIRKLGATRQIFIPSSGDIPT